MITADESEMKERKEEEIFFFSFVSLVFISLTFFVVVLYFANNSNLPSCDSFRT